MIFLYPPPKKKKKKTGCFFFGGGGMFFWDKIMNFCPIGIKKILARILGRADLPATYRPISGRFRPQTHNRNLKNMAFFGIFGKFWQLFFSKIFFAPKSPQNHFKLFLGASLGLKDDSYIILNLFWQIKSLIFSTFFVS